MYFCNIAVLFYFELLSLTSYLISLKSLLTIIPLPRLVSSPGLIIQILCNCFGIDKSSSIVASGILVPSGRVEAKLFYELYALGFVVSFS
jgi:hypothetical protein